jgi:RNA polymerase sigma-70 factor, ECF subfamily
MNPAQNASPLVCQRQRYLALAYRMLGSRMDAEDVVQEAFLRLGASGPAVEDPERYTFRTVANLCVDRLRAERVRRRTYPGPWLPEPMIADGEPDDLLDLARSLSLGFLLLLERLSPAERVVFVLREAFDLDFRDIADLLGVSEQACRQRLSRARRNLRGAAVASSRPAANRDLLQRLMTAVAEQQVEAVVRLLSDDALLVTDGGGVVSAAIRPVEGGERIARVLIHIAAREQTPAPLDAHPVNLNGDWGLVFARGGVVHSVVTIESRNDSIRRIYVLRNPAKLASVAEALGMTV